MLLSSQYMFNFFVNHGGITRLADAWEMVTLDLIYRKGGQLAL